MTTKTKAGLLQFFMFFIFTLIFALIINFYFTHHWIGAFFAGFLGVLIAPVIKIENGKIVYKWIWNKDRWKGTKT